MTAKKQGTGGVGRNKEIDDVAVFDHFMVGIQRGLSVERVGNAGYRLAELKPCPDGRRLEYRERYLKPETVKRRFRAIKSNPLRDAQHFAKDRSAEEVSDIVRQIYANMKFIGGLSMLSPQIAQPLELKPGRPTKQKSRRAI